MSSEFHCRPCEFFGLHLSIEDSMLAYQVDRVVFSFGSWVKARMDETIEVNAPKRPKNERPKETKPKYSSEQIEGFIYGPLPDPAMVSIDPTAPHPWGNIDPFSVVAEPSRPVPARYRNGPKFIPHEVTN